MAASVNQLLAQVQRWTDAARTAELSDAVLLGCYVHQRDEAAFAALVARHGALVWRVCRRILGNFQEAEDAFQAVFLILARKAASLKQPEALPGWLHGVARRVALKARTKDAARPGNAPLAEELSDCRADPLSQLTARELLEIVDEEVGRLPVAQQSVVVLCCLEGHTREEAARILGCTNGAIKGHLQRGRQRLQKRLERRGIALSAALALIAVSRGEAASTLLLQDGRTLLEASESGWKMFLWEVATGQLRRTVSLSNFPHWDVAFSPDGRRIAVTQDAPGGRSAKSLPSIWLFDLASNCPPSKRIGHDGAITGSSIRKDLV